MALAMLILGGLLALALMALAVRRARRQPEPSITIVERQAVREVLMRNVVRIAPR